VRVQSGVIGKCRHALVLQPACNLVGSISRSDIDNTGLAGVLALNKMVHLENIRPAGHHAFFDTPGFLFSIHYFLNDFKLVLAKHIVSEVFFEDLSGVHISLHTKPLRFSQ